jgi:hypothetical protein
MFRPNSTPQLEISVDAIDALKDVASGDITKFGGEMFFEGISAAKIENPQGPSIRNDYSERLYKAGHALGRAALNIS